MFLQLACTSSGDWKHVSFVTASACPVWLVVAGPDEDSQPHAETLKANRTRGALPQWACSVQGLFGAALPTQWAKRGQQTLPDRPLLPGSSARPERLSQSRTCLASCGWGDAPWPEEARGSAVLPLHGARGPEESIYAYHTFADYVAFMSTCLANGWLSAESSPSSAVTWRESSARGARLLRTSRVVHPLRGR